MGRAPCCSKVGLMRGPWSAKEDSLLTEYIKQHGEGQWRSLPKKAGLLRCGKSCRLRWMNYLRPGIVRGNIGEDEEDLIVRLHGLLGNRWSLIAGRLPGRTDNEIKNYWNTYLLKKLQNAGIDTNSHKALPTKPSKKSKNNHVITDNPRKKQKPSKKSTDGQRNADAKVNGEDVDGVARVKVHLPKPMRVTSLSVMPRTESRSSFASGAASSSSNGSSGGEAAAAAAADVTWKPPVFELGEGVADYYGAVIRRDYDDDERDGFLGGGGGDDGFLLPALDRPVDSVPVGGEGDDAYMFDSLFDEYLQLFNF